MGGKTFGKEGTGLYCAANFSIKRPAMKSLSILLLSVICSSAWAADTPATAPTPAAPWTLLDQFEKAYTLDHSARVVLVARSMSTARLVNGALEEKPAGYLEARHVVYVADIEKMPSLAKMVAVPAMRSANYRIMLDQTGRVAGRYDGDRETVQWLELEGGSVVREKRFSDAGELQSALEALSR
ncbi:hypothetical protein SAMN05216381_3002 [Pseudomonas seleniipraecipitans]|uniref:FAD/FMN-containing dehydrogenase n=2 Tax=Phytopseudomonas seleniipraecipitans TaxID=640205 RepID=A0A1G7R075_9GAMM|nr:hypothetical protein SAMN05216381_3002 [Pseudomonas seleniipraecipitans]